MSDIVILMMAHCDAAHCVAPSPLTFFLPCAEMLWALASSPALVLISQTALTPAPVEFLFTKVLFMPSKRFVTAERLEFGLAPRAIRIGANGRPNSPYDRLLCSDSL